MKTGEPCEVVQFDKSVITNTKLVCKTPPQISAAQEYVGNRGINMIVDNVVTSVANLQSAQPSGSAQSTIENATSYLDTTSSAKTVWFKGFFVSEKTSAYELTLDTNGDAILLFSDNSASAGKVNEKAVCLFIFGI